MTVQVNEIFSTHLMSLFIFADAIDDYVPQDRQLSFSPKQERLCHRVMFNDDETVEQRESFGLTLDRTSGLHDRVNVCPEPAEVVIPNNDGEIVAHIEIHVVA